MSSGLVKTREAPAIIKASKSDCNAFPSKKE